MTQLVEFLDTRRAADMLGLSPATLEGWRTRGGGPTFRKFGKAVRYYRADLERFIEASGRTSTSKVAA